MLKVYLLEVKVVKVTQKHNENDSPVLGVVGVLGEGRDERDVVGDCADDVDVLEEGGQMGRVQQLEQGGKHSFRVLGGLWKGRKERGKERNMEWENDKKHVQGTEKWANGKLPRCVRGRREAWAGRHGVD